MTLDMEKITIITPNMKNTGVKNTEAKKNRIEIIANSIIKNEGKEKIMKKIPHENRILLGFLSKMLKFSLNAVSNLPFDVILGRVKFSKTKKTY